ncbi:MAG TPA: hypothetical protein VM686_34340 [Polyangiaceae bacterium]|nr:hypothetical protein [Polyangiaceae bacterium]
MQLPIRTTWDGLPIEPAEQVDVRIVRAGPDFTIAVQAPFHADAPPALPAGSCPELWLYEAVECFLVGEGERYLEVELGPHGHYLLLALEGTRNIVRQGMPARFQAEIDHERRRWRGSITVPRELVPQPITRVNAFALHGQEPERRYLCHWPLPGARPDFHQIARFPPFSAPTDAAGEPGAPGG